MQRVIAIADQSTLPVLKFLAGINILSLLSLAAMVGMAVGQARASNMACGGNHLMGETPEKVPGTYAN
jgi:hypothetical protein